jgi:hypothetical protein
VEVEVGQLADMCAAVLGCRGFRIERPDMQVESPVDRYVGDGTTMARLTAHLGLSPAPLPAQILETAAYLWDDADAKSSTRSSRAPSPFPTVLPEGGARE